jgi:uncharacterized protein
MWVSRVNRGGISPVDPPSPHTQSPHFTRTAVSSPATASSGHLTKVLQSSRLQRNTGRVVDRNVLGGPLQPCGTDPLTGFYRDGCCSSGAEDLGRHTICVVVTAEFLEHQRSIGNDLLTPVPEYRFPGLLPGDRWCVTALNWLRAHNDGCAAPVVLASTNERTLEVVPLEALLEHKVDVPDDLANL